MGRQLDDGDSGLPDSQAGELFMATFAVVGALALLDIEPAVASQPTVAFPLSVEEAQALLRGGAAAPAIGSPVSAAPAASDAAFLAAIVALGSPADGSVYVFPPPAPAADGAALAPSDFGGDAFTSYAGDDPVGSSAPPETAGAGLSVRGDNLVVALAANVNLTLQGADDLVFTRAGDTLAILSGSSVEVQGVGVRIELGSQDKLTLSGVGFDVHAAGAGDTVSLTAASQANIAGDGLAVDLGAPDASATIFGAGNVIQGGADSVTVGGGDAGQDNAVYLQSGGAVNLLAASTLAAYGAGAAYLGANDYVNLFGAYDVYGQTSGVSTLASFGGADTLHLHSGYGDIAALLGGASESNGATTLYLNGADDAVTFLGLGKTQLAALAGSGHIKLD